MSKFFRPALPFQTGIPGGIHEGKMVEIKGRIPYGAGRFEINLIAASSDRPLHLSIRFDQQCVVRNHLQYGQWGSEERQGPFPFSFGRDFTLLIVADRDSYRIAVNHQHCWDFRHRLPMNRVQSFGVQGSVEVHEVEFIGQRNPVCTPVTRASLTPVYNPTIPYAYPIYGGLRRGMKIHISGRPSANPYRFTINLQKGSSQYPPPDVAFHFDPRFFNRSVVRNTRTNGVWAAEETHISRFPFHPGVHFDLLIQVATNRYVVHIDGVQFIDFRHRLRPLERFDTLYIESDVSISSIHFS